MIRILLILCSIFLIEIHGIHRRCINSGVLFPDKILSSPIVIYGESISKRIYHDSNTELLYNVTFRVDCILKGQDIGNRIEITEAGIKSGHTACQWLDPGHLYVVFLEQWRTNMNGYRPLDFQEQLVDNMTYELLAKTCHLTHISPLHSTTNKCPNVSMIQYCPHDEIDMNMMPKQKSSDNIKSSYFNDGNQFYLQSNVTITKSGTIETQFGKQSSKSACLLPMTWISMIIITILYLQGS